jgi:hypothetical protein
MFRFLNAPLLSPAPGTQQVRVCEGDLCDPAFVAALFAPTNEAPALALGDPCVTPEGGPAGGVAGAAASSKEAPPWPLRVDRVVSAVWA